MTYLSLKKVLYIPAIVLTLALTACSKPQTTDVDYMGKRFTENKPEYEFRKNCKKPKAFIGVNKYKVDCIVSVSKKAWDPNEYKSHSSFGYILNTSGYRGIGSTSIPGVFLKRDNYDYPIYIVEKRTSNPRCFRRLYIDISEINQPKQPPIGSRLIIADPWVLSCTDIKQN